MHTQPHDSHNTLRELLTHTKSKHTKMKHTKNERLCVKKIKRTNERTHGFRSAQSIVQIKSLRDNK